MSEQSAERLRTAAFEESSPARVLDPTDLEILHYLQEDGRVSSAELARRVKLSAPGLQKRLRKLEESGVIESHVTLVNREAVGFDLLCFVHVTLAHHLPESVGQFREQVKRLPEVLECHHLTGEYDYSLKVVVRNHKHLEQFLFEGLTQIQGVDKIRTSIVLSEIKSSTALPLGRDDGSGSTGKGVLRHEDNGDS